MFTDAGLTLDDRQNSGEGRVFELVFPVLLKAGQDEQ